MPPYATDEWSLTCLREFVLLSLLAVAMCAFFSKSTQRISFAGWYWKSLLLEYPINSAAPAYLQSTTTVCSRGVGANGSVCRQRAKSHNRLQRPNQGYFREIGQASTATPDSEPMPSVRDPEIGVSRQQTSIPTLNPSTRWRNEVGVGGARCSYCRATPRRAVTDMR